MKRILYLLIESLNFCYITPCIAQNIGVGTTTPQTKLHVVDGVSGYSGSYLPGFTFEGSGNRYIDYIVPAANETGLLFGNPSSSVHGGIIYNNTSTPSGIQFRTNGNLNRMVIDANGNIGIGILNPGFPLNFSNSVGDKIALWGNSGAHYGFGVQSGLLQIYSDVSTSDIAFGYGSSTSLTENLRIKGNGVLQFPAALAKKIIFYPGATGDASIGVFGNEFRIASDYNGADITFGYDMRPSTFTERMRIKGNGNVGIGNNNPAYWLDVNGRMRIRSGGAAALSAGLWFNNNSNVEAAFVGMEDDTHVGLYGNNGATWKFSMNTQTGALKVNGSEGTTNQVLASNGTGSSPGWQSLSSLIKTYYLYNDMCCAGFITVNTMNEYLLFNSTFNLTITQPTRLIISAGFNILPQCPIVGSCDGRAEFYFKVDGTLVSTSRVNVKSSGDGDASATLPNFFYDIAPGSHTINFYTRKDQVNGSNDLYVFLTSATIIALPL